MFNSDHNRLVPRSASRSRRIIDQRSRVLTYLGFGCLIIVLLSWRHFVAPGRLYLGSRTAGRSGYQQLRWTPRYERLLDDVRNKTLGFEKIFVITMPTRLDHRDTLALAAALTPDGGLDFDIVDGVTALPPKYLLPPWGKAENETGPQLGPQQETPRWVKCWRAHMNVLRLIVERNIASAIIAESDLDWDIRIKSQLQHFAKASSLLLHAKRQDDSHDIADTPSFSVPTTSPYGDLDRWDLLWLGHCGMSVPQASAAASYPKGRVMFQDPTVPEREHLQYFEFVNDRVLTGDHPHHTRMVHWANRGMCQTAYAISQRGARKMLYEMGVNRFYAPNDIMTRDWCDTGLAGSPRANCLGVQPPLFASHHPAGPVRGFSDIKETGTGFNRVPVTPNIRHSTKMNLGRLIAGRTDYIDQWPDAE